MACREIASTHITPISSSLLNCRLDQLVVQKADGTVAFEWVPLSCRCRRLMLHGGLGQNAAQPDSLRQVGLHAWVSGNLGGEPMYTVHHCASSPFVCNRHTSHSHAARQSPLLCAHARRC